MDCGSSVFWEDLEKGVNGVSSILIIMEVGAVGLLARVELSAAVDLEVQRMVFLLLPAVGVFASIFVFAPISVGLDKILGLPLRALIFLVFEYVWLSPEVLPVMSVNTDVPGVGCV